ncbi:hypothetical protein BCV69DRAFT_26937 [Microstroma glucosiphilum]|uniref:Sorting nexin 8/Mvp1 BAR domain-containing protein n=1 Tax=Pseudomicrostroma glucosiphilum TaxID=1684307 RepID=A0A316U310_9BASI|nr:hypothetical protein BCV69DRAFT_26937 [Pseudomicrostroma glucosiphilum]PWN19627.1 hypothetical protein BCV69DRAFT_26937 [Pseudomicrostroma glucosiphilum]
MSEYKLSHPNISLEEESTIALPPSTALVTVPRDLSTKLDLTTTQTPTMVDRWSTLCTLFERIAKRIESQGGDYARLGSLIDAISQGGGAGAGASAGAGVGPGRSTSPPISSSSPAIISSSSSSALASSLHRDFSDLCTVRSRSLTLHALEGLKTQRDLWLSWRDLLARHVALAGDNVPSLKSQVASTRAKLAALNAVAPAQRPPTFHADVAKVEETLRTDSLQIERLLQRRERVRAAMWEELGLLAARKEEVAGVWREWCKEELLGRAAQKRAVEECWAQMSGAGGAGGGAR